jgi:hypothetical protein
MIRYSLYVGYPVIQFYFSIALRCQIHNCAGTGTLISVVSWHLTW